MGQYFANPIIQKLPSASLVNLTPPTFAGAISAIAKDVGAIRLAWALATGSYALPARYEIYMLSGSVSAATLYASRSNIAQIEPEGSTAADINQLADNLTYIVKGQQYTLGVRAVSAVGVSDTNTVVYTVTATASGNLPVILQDLATALAATHVDLAADHADLSQDHLDLEAEIDTLETLVTTLGVSTGSLQAALLPAGIVGKIERTEEIRGRLISESIELEGCLEPI